MEGFFLGHDIRKNKTKLPSTGTDLCVYDFFNKSIHGKLRDAAIESFY